MDKVAPLLGCPPEKLGVLVGAGAIGIATSTVICLSTFSLLARALSLGKLSLPITVTLPSVVTLPVFAFALKSPPIKLPPANFKLVSFTTVALPVP